jgi:hypothetical protein
MRARPSIIVAAVVGLSAALTGCVVAPAYPRYPVYADEGVYDAPPPPRYEVIGVAPYPSWFWIGGFWTWSGGRHAWVGGRWEAPRPGYRWEPHRWEPVSGGGRGWRERPGHWSR